MDDHVRLVGALAGIGSGLAKVAVGHGFDTIKTRMQCSPPGTYRGALDVLSKTIRTEGILALYKGVTPPAVGWAAVDSLLMGSLHNYRLFLVVHGMTEPTPGSGIPRLTLLGHGFAGLFAGMTSSFLATPMELLKVKLQLQLEKSTADRQFKGPIDCASQIVRTRGWPGLWSGFQGSLAFRVNFFWMFGSFEALMRGFSRLDGTSYQISTGTANFMSGGLAALSFWIFAIPADNVKNRIMSHPYPHSLLASTASPSVFAVAQKIYVQEGLAGFYRGLGPSLLRAFPANACALFVYEGLMRGLAAEKTRR